MTNEDFVPDYPEQNTVGLVGFIVIALFMPLVSLIGSVSGG